MIWIIITTDKWHDTQRSTHTYRQDVTPVGSDHRTRHTTNCEPHCSERSANIHREATCYNKSQTSGWVGAGGRCYSGTIHICNDNTHGTIKQNCAPDQFPYINEYRIWPIWEENLTTNKQTTGLAGSGQSCDLESYNHLPVTVEQFLSIPSVERNPRGISTVRRDRYLEHTALSTRQFKPDKTCVRQ